MKKGLNKSTFAGISTVVYKENQIQDLKQEAFQLKDLQYDLFRLNDQITGIEAKYAMTLDQKQRNETLLKNKLSISKKNMQDLQADVDQIRTQIDQTNLAVINVTRDNTTLQKTCTTKENQILGLTVAIKQLEKTNQVKLYELQEDQQALKKIKQCKKKMQEQCEKLCKRLNQNTQTYKQLDKQNKNQTIMQRSLTATLQGLKQENQSLMTEMNVRQKVLKQTSEQYENICKQARQAADVEQKLKNQCKGLQDSYQQVAKVLQRYQRQNESKEVKLRQLEGTSLKSEEQLNKSVLKKESLMKQHSDLATKNKDLNLEIDDCIIKILQLQNVNKSLQRNIESYITYDEQARMLLDRRQKMTELLQDVSFKLNRTSQKISHLMC